MVRRLFAALLGLAAALLGTDPCWSQPQYNVAVMPGVAWAGSDADPDGKAAFYGGLHADALLGTERSSDWGLGPFVDLSTVGFADFRSSAGASALLPVMRGYPVVVSAGGCAIRTASGWEPGLASWAFVGARGHNFHGNYAPALGMALGLQVGLGQQRTRAVVLALHLDGLLLALPAIAGYEWASR